MDNIVIESFITYCDEMMIPAEEGLKDIKTEYTRIINEVNTIKDRLSVEKNIKAALIQYKEIVRLLTDLESSISKIQLSAFDKSVGAVTKIISVISGIGAAIGAHKVATIVDSGKLGKYGASAISGVGAFALTNKALSKIGGNPEKNRNIILQEIDSQLRRASNCVIELSQIIQNKVSLDDFTYSSINKKYYEIRFKKLKPMIMKLKKELTDKIIPLLPKECINQGHIFAIEWKDSSTMVYITFTERDIEIDDQVCSAIKKFDMVVSQFINRNKSELKQLETSDICINNDDILSVSIDLDEGDGVTELSRR